MFVLAGKYIETILWMREPLKFLRLME